MVYLEEEIFKKVLKRKKAQRMGLPVGEVNMDDIKKEVKYFRIESSDLFRIVRDMEKRGLIKRLNKKRFKTLEV